MAVPRPEYPRPQCVRADWLNLNGEWQFEIDHGDSGIERNILNRELEQRITVPFSPESKLGGVNYVDRMAAVWYRREVEIPAAWAGRRPVLHFQAVDYDATVWANGVEVGRHRGGFTPFSCDLSAVAQPGDTVTIVLRARDTYRGPQARGKQSEGYAPAGAHYTRTTGIWQTVWLEPLPPTALKRPRITPDLANGCFHLEQPMTENTPGLRLRATLSDDAGAITTAECAADLDFAARLMLAVPDDRRRVWAPGDPHLYELSVELVDAGGSTVDRVESYAGLRSIAINGRQVLLNGEVLFQRLVLDQGYYPDGVMTAPDDAALIRDIELSMAAGFNGARLHQKVFEERFLYHADRMGYLVWGEFPDWGVGGFGPRNDHQRPDVSMVAQWLEELERDYSHPAIVGWCALNETWQELQDRTTVLDDATRALFLAAKAMDTSRPVLDTSGYSHRVAETDIYDSHDYIGEQDWATGIANFTARHAKTTLDRVYANPNDANDGTPSRWSLPYRGQPYFVSEFGGFKWRVDETPVGSDFDPSAKRDTWGYGSAPTSIEDFYTRFAAVCDVLLDNPEMFGYCYTQLTDIFPEENGIFTFDRRPKFDLERVRAIQQRQAAIEK